MRHARALLVAVVLLVVHDGSSTAQKAVVDYRYFRALSVDLQGRLPTRAEIADFERPDFNLDHWIDAHLAGSPYVARVLGIYEDMLKLELPATYHFEPGLSTLYSLTVQSPKGPVAIWYRIGQRRANPDTDGQPCFSEAESGLKVIEAGRQGAGTAKPIDQKLLDERTVVVKPWWLYADYQSAEPKDRVTAARYPGLDVTWADFKEPDGQPTTAIRVCKEETQTADHGRVTATGRKTAADAASAARTTRAPLDTAFATAHAGEQISCSTTTGYRSSSECGCGRGLERCLPGTPPAFGVATQTPLGADQPFVETPRPAWLWHQEFWSAEANHFLAAILDGDRDFREVLTGRGSVVNGPLAQFYRFMAGSTCCGTYGPELGYSDPEPLFDPTAAPSDLSPFDVATWKPVADRGPHAAGVLTMPIFLVKYGTRRARAHVVYQAFLCKDFIASHELKLEPSTEPDLMVREGCASCHMELEPMASYFARVEESSWNYLPQKLFPLSLPRCTNANPKLMRPECKTYYDPAFTDDKRTTLRGGYGDRDNVDKGPAGFAQDIVASPEFAPCVVQNLAQSLIGRELTPDDDAWKAQLAKSFVAGGYRMRALVRGIVTSPQYRPGAL